MLQLTKNFLFRSLYIETELVAQVTKKKLSDLKLMPLMLQFKVFKQTMSPKFCIVWLIKRLIQDLLKNRGTLMQIQLLELSLIRD